jgi:hypothetical protein
MKTIILLDPKTPHYLYGLVSIPDYLNIYTLSKELNVQSPVEKLILVPKATGEFGWEGSTGFLIAAAKSKKHSSVAPKFYSRLLKLFRCVKFGEIIILWTGNRDSRR